MLGFGKHKPIELFPEGLSKKDLQNFDTQNQQQEREKAQAKTDFLNAINHYILKTGDLAVAEGNDIVKFEDLSPETIFNFCPKDKHGQPLLSPDELMDALGLTMEFLSMHDATIIRTNTGKTFYYPVPAIAELYFIRNVHLENVHKPVIVDTFSLSIPEVVNKSKRLMDKSMGSIDQPDLEPTEEEIDAIRKMVDNGDKK